MATLREIRSRINTVKNIEKITQAMKLVAAARLNKAQQRVQAARPYAEMMQQVMQQLSTAAGELSHPLLEVREERNIAAIIMTSDRGLCGSYNTNMIRKAMELLRPRDPATVRLVLMGRKGITFFRRQRYPIEVQLPLNGQRLLNEQALDLLAFRCSLVGNQLHSEDLPGKVSGFFHALGDLYSATLTATTGMDLGLYHHTLGAI